MYDHRRSLSAEPLAFDNGRRRPVKQLIAEMSFRRVCDSQQITEILKTFPLPFARIGKPILDGVAKGARRPCPPLLRLLGRRRPRSGPARRSGCLWIPGQRHLPLGHGHEQLRLFILIPRIGLDQGSNLVGESIVLLPGMSQGLGRISGLPMLCWIGQEVPPCVGTIAGYVTTPHGCSPLWFIPLAFRYV